MEQEAAAALHSLKCQYFQLVEPRLLAFPPAHILRKTNFQERLFSDVFAPDAVADSAYAPPPRYSARVLKEVVSLIESSVDAEEEEEAPEVNEQLLELYVTLLATPSPPADPTKKSAVTYTLPAPLLPITILETPALISGLGTTGLRTWEAALALAEVLLLQSPVQMAGKKVLELGAGTGLVSLVAARLGARVLATDGDEGVVEGLRGNVSINDMAQEVEVQVRRWAGGREWPEEKVDLVLGADVTYDAEAIPWLVAEIVWTLQEHPGVKVLIAATMRNVDTFEVFRTCCAERGLAVTESVYELPSPRVFWYVPRAEIRIVEVRKQAGGERVDGWSFRQTEYLRA